MTPALSIWLDLCRILAALAVYIGHSAALGVAPEAVSMVWHRSADDAVTAFFVISGLVIAHTARTGEGAAAHYALARLSRVYSVALPAVLFVLLVDKVGMLIDVSHYEPQWQYPRLWLYLPLHWLFLGETWFGAIYPFSMAPYWSLGYEVWYYVLFGCVAFVHGRWRWPVLFIVLAVMGPRIWLLLPTWWFGVALYRRLSSLRLQKQVARILMVAALLGYAAFISGGWREACDQASQQLYAFFNLVLPLPFHRGSTVHVLSDYVVAFLFGVLVVGSASCGITFGQRTGRLIRALAAFTFTFYLIHYTLLLFAAVLGFSQVGWFSYGAILVAILASTWCVGQLGEQRRHIYRAALLRMGRAVVAGWRRGVNGVR
jgi:peptidoglycan/LPS O-acetylase OafA/YrhL